MLKLKSHLSLVMLAVLTLLLLSCASNQIILYPIRDTDFYKNDKGDYCMTEFYLNEVLQVKIENKR